MKDIMMILYGINAIAVILLVLFQGRGAGLGSAWGGSGETFATRRGVEKLTFTMTFATIGLFLILSILNIFFI